MVTGKQDIPNFTRHDAFQRLLGIKLRLLTIQALATNKLSIGNASDSSHCDSQRPRKSRPNITVHKDPFSSLTQDEEPRRISFMSNDSTPYTSLLMRLRASRQDSCSSGSEVPTPSYLTSLLSHHSELYKSNTGMGSWQSDNLGGNETLLLEMVRAQIRDIQKETQDRNLQLPRDDVSDDQSIEPCIHGLNMRMIERSMSRSRVSRMSSRRDMDIPSILAFTTNLPAPQKHLEIPAFTKINTPQTEEIPRWSIRRSVCPVCSQKWRDRSTISSVRYSGLKRNSSTELPSVIAPARLRASITMAYAPRPALPAVDEDKSVGHGALRNAGATWQLTRARRFRIPKPQIPSPEATAPPSAAAPLARKDLDIRVNRFLSD